MPQITGADAQARPEAVFDCNLFFRAAIQNHGYAYRCVLLLDFPRFTLFYSQQILDEINDVLRRPSLRQRFPQLTDENIDDLLQKLEHQAVKITNVPETFRYSRDPEDAISFRHRFPGLKIVDPQAFLEMLEAQSSL